MAGHEAQFAGNSAVVEECLSGGGQMGALMRETDWSKTPLGPVSSWPQSLRTSVSICLNSLFPILVWWGPELIMLYNDAYRPVLGTTKHPRALGAAGREIWPEIWNIIGPMLNGVLKTGQATWSDDKLLMLDRNGYLEECYFTFSYSAIRQEDGHVGGVFCAVRETTERVLAERRLHILQDLAYQATQTKTRFDACQKAVRALSAGRLDAPFAAFYLIEPKEAMARLCEASGLEPGSEHCPHVVRLAESGDADPWGFRQILETRQSFVIKELGPLGSSIPVTDWGIPPGRAAVISFLEPGSNNAGAILVVGLNPCRAWDEDYRSFLDLAAGHISAAIANATAYEEERRRTEALLELDRAKTAFFSNVSHEFRTPLTLMLGPLEELSRSSQLPASLHADLDMVHRNSMRLLKLVNTLLDFARIEASRARAVYEPTDLAVMTADLASAFRSAIEKAGVKMIVDCPSLPQDVYVDREMWEKIVLNLVSNAFKFTFEGQITVSLRWMGDHVELKVSDTGTGIPAEELPRVFDRFHRVPNARSRTHEGTGIGLALVKELVRFHAGSITVSSEVERGTTFLVTIPTGNAHLPKERIRATRTQASTAAGATPFVAEALRWLPDDLTDQEAAAEAIGAEGSIAQAPAARETGRVLLADDNADMRAYLRQLLSHYWTVETAGDGASALKAALDDPPDLVLTDIMMGGLDGLKLLEQLRTHPATREVPVILLSARAGEEARVEGMEAGADDYLVKPFSARELVARVRTHLQLARSRSHTDRALRESEERLRLATEIGRIGMWYLDLSDNRIEFSDRCRTIFGLQPDTPLTLESILRVVHPEDRLKLGKTIEHALKTTEHVHTDYRLLLPDGSIRWIMARSRSIADESGKIRANIGVAMDITAPKEFEQQLLDFNARLEQRVDERTEEVRRLAEHLRALTSELTQAEQRERKRVATILHDHIQQLLVAARMQISIGRRSIGDPAPLETLLRADRHLAEAIRASRSLTTELSPPILHEAGLAAGLDWLAEQAREQHQWTVEVISDPAAEPESEDVRLFLFGAVRELLFNACKYSGVPLARITMGRASEKWTKITVEDQGRGFDPEAIKKENRPTAGGFGLFSIQQRLSYIGGEMEIESAPGKGTRVTLLAPLGEVRADDTLAAVKSVFIGQTQSHKERREGGRIRVIVADDHKVMREGLRSMLQLEPDMLVVAEAEDGEQAVELAKQLQPDVILMDITMPRMGGIEATRLIRHHLPHISVIGLSMHVDTAIMSAMTEAGAGAYLTKDEPIERVMATIRSMKAAPLSRV